MTRSGLLFRLARRSDLPSIARMLADDELGNRRERYVDPLPGSYASALEQIARDANHKLIVAEQDGDVIGTVHLMFLPSLSFQGGLRARVESVCFDKRCQNRGIGREMMRWAIERAKGRGAHVLQLTTHHTRVDAHRFYERLGFQGSRLGMKLILIQK